MEANPTVLAGAASPDPEPWPSFSPAVLEFLAHLSDALRADPVLGRDEEAAAFAFWCRRGHLAALHADHVDGAARLGRGLIFHVAPSNVPLLFLYSLAVGLLAGNANVVRLSGRAGGPIPALCALLSRLLELPEHAPIQARVSVVSYPRQAAGITRAYSERCDGRVVWGGDASVRALRGLPLKPAAVDVAFPDRWSLCLLSEAHVAGLDTASLDLLAHRFCNDAYRMDQNACSSPRLVLWLQDADVPDGTRDRWWRAVAGQAGDYTLTPYMASEKYAALCRLAMEEPAVARVERWGNLLYRVILIRPPVWPEAIRARGGTFLEYGLRALEELADFDSPRLQTVTCAGIAPAAVGRAAAAHRLRGITRAVPVGQALAFDPIWDGVDLLEALSRRITW